MKKSAFRTYDIRGIIGDELHEKDFFVLGYAFGRYILEEQSLGYNPQGAAEVVVGYDGRSSSPCLHRLLLAGLKHSGCIAYDVGLATSPYVFYVAKARNAIASVMVTASHNPSHYNGMKIAYRGQPFWGEQLCGLYERCKQMHEKYGDVEGIYRSLHSDNSESVFLNTASTETPTQTIPYHRLYTDELKTLIHQKPHINAAWDLGHGSVIHCAALLLERLQGWNQCLLHSTFQENGGAHGPDPSKLYVRNAIMAHLDKTLPYAFLFDGDGDRLIVVDHTGHTWSGDELIAYIAVASGVRKVYMDIKASMFIVRHLEQRYGCSVLMVPTGHVYMKQQMTIDAIGGEVSGHMFLPAITGSIIDDGLSAACVLLNLLCQKHVDMCAWRMTLPKVVALNYRFAVSRHCALQIIEQVKAYFVDRIDCCVCHLDGVRVEHKDRAWFLLRPSNTEPYMMVMVQALLLEDLTDLECLLHKALEGAEDVMCAHTLQGWRDAQADRSRSKC